MGIPYRVVPFLGVEVNQNTGKPRLCRGGWARSVVAYELISGTAANLTGYRSTCRFFIGIEASGGKLFRNIEEIVF
jgi:hypothetical protein